MSIYLDPNFPERTFLEWFNSPLCTNNLDDPGRENLRRGYAEVKSGVNCEKLPSDWMHSIDFRGVRY